MIKFECNGCGRCCITTTPSLTISEFLSLYKEMPSVALFEFSSLEEDKHKRGFKIKNKNGIKYNVIAQLIAIPNINGCNNLNEDLMCEIYEKRPSVCKLYPINPGISVDGVKKGLEIEKARKNDDACEGFNDESPVIFMENSLVDKNTENLILTRIEDDKNSTLLLKEMYEKLMEFDYISSEINSKKKGTSLVCTEDLLLFMKEKEIIDGDQFKEMATKQKMLFVKLKRSFDEYLMNSDDFKDGIKEIIDYNLIQFE